MKTLIISLFGVFIIFGAVAQEAAEATAGPEITFQEDAFAFGEIHQGDIVEHIFTFENTGNEVLIITNVQTTCGCTAPEWPRDPIAPGQTGDVRVVFNSTGKMGKQNKVITVISNAKNPRTQVSINTTILPQRVEK